MSTVRGNVLTMPVRSAERDPRLINALRARARRLIDYINGVVGQAMLYYTENAGTGTWFLYGRPSEDAIDRLLLHGATNVDGFARLVARLQEQVTYKREVRV